MGQRDTAFTLRQARLSNLLCFPFRSHLLRDGRALPVEFACTADGRCAWPAVSFMGAPLASIATQVRAGLHDAEAEYRRLMR